MKTCAVFLLCLLAWLPVQAQTSVIIVAPNGDYATLQAALDAAQNGDTIEVHGGTYPAVVIEKSITLIGLDHPVIDAGGTGNIVTITAPDVILQGFTLRNSGSRIDHEDAGVLVNQAPRVTVAENRLENVLFGIKLMGAPDSIARENLIQGQNREVGIRGDSLTVWYSSNVYLENNVAVTTRDMLISYADNIHIQGNTIRDSRYGLHFMYSNEVLVQGNTLENNSVGAFLMYSKNITISGNTFAYNRGSSGYGLALKDMDGVSASDNTFVGNTVGLYLDNSPALYEGFNTFSNNLFAYNDIGTTALPSVERNIFTRNIYLKNLQQIGIQGREMTSRNLWNQDGVGNYWSDYAGYDADGNGVGDLTYRADKLFESLGDQYPAVQLFSFSPAAQAIEFTASAFPLFRPVPRVIDDAPLISYTLPPSNQPLATPFLLMALVLMGVPLVLYYPHPPTPSPRMGRGVNSPLPKGEGLGVRVVNQQENIMITVQKLTKKYGKYTALADLSFEVKAGEAIALWGTNGAGKTTTLRCLLGLYPFEGQVQINGVNVRKNGKAARAMIGYVPQEVAFYDQSVLEALKFHARLKKVSAAQLPDLLTLVGLSDHAAKPVRALSGGMKQRLALAIGLIGDPPLLLLDESTANLDAQVRYEFLEMIQKLKHSGKTIIFCTHRLEEVMTLADRVLVLKAGTLQTDCAPADLPEKLGLTHWLRIWVPDALLEMAFQMMQKQGFTSVMNSRSFYVKVLPGSKIEPLRTLENARIPIQNFEIVDGSHHDF